MKDALLIAGVMLLFSAAAAGLVGTGAAAVVEKQMEAVRLVSTTLDDAIKGN